MTNTPGTRPSQAGAQGNNPIEEPLDELKDEGRRLAEEAKTGARQAAEAQKGTVSAYLRDLAEAVDQGAGTLERHGHRGTASLMTTAAGEFGSLVDGLADRPIGELVEKVESFARRRPALFFGAAFLAGFSGTRFLRTSATEAKEESSALGSRTSGSPSGSPSGSQGQAEGQRP